MARPPSNSHSDNYTGFKLFATLRPQSNFRINLRFDRELAEVWQTWNGVLGLLTAFIIPMAGLAHLGSRGPVPSCNSGKKISQSINESTPN